MCEDSFRVEPNITALGLTKSSQTLVSKPWNTHCLSTVAYPSFLVFERPLLTECKDISPHYILRNNFYRPVYVRFFSSSGMSC